MIGELNFVSNIGIAEQFSHDIHEKIVLHTGDSLDFLKTIPDNSISLVVTSPPYNVGKSYESKTSIETYLKTQEAVIEQLYRVLKEEGSICWQVGNYINKGEVFPLDIYYYPMFKNLGMQLRNRIIWHFGHGLHASKRFSGRYETLLWFSKTDNYFFHLDPVRVPSKYPGKLHYKPGDKHGQPSGNPLGKNPSDIWDILLEDWEKAMWDIPNVKSNHPEKTQHPCQFPIELVSRCVLALTKENDWVLDPYSGVGSTILSAISNDRRGIGVERDADFNHIAVERISQYYNGTLRVRPLGKKVYVPTGKEKVAQIPEEWKTSDNPDGI